MGAGEKKQSLFFLELLFSLDFLDPIVIRLLSYTLLLLRVLGKFFLISLISRPSFLDNFLFSSNVFQVALSNHFEYYL